ncbi:hypothetical protein B0H10DRAFT_2219876 [Mycena sp. CBHHK59/15]|nr:hypothetical protein B0H10DRAFT_2219876 [Mycena sp. CBHHK59/15]
MLLKLSCLLCKLQEVNYSPSSAPPHLHLISDHPDFMCSLLFGHPPIFSTQAEHLQDTLDHVQHGISWHRLLTLTLQLLAWLLSTSLSILLRFLPLIASVTCFLYILNACQHFWVTKLAGNWEAAFPIPCTMFVITLVAVPMWGLTMAGFMFVWIVVP